jgi:hypothetical protein
VVYSHAVATRSAIEGIHAAEGLHRGCDDALAVLRSAYVTVNNAGIGNAATGLEETPE